jgi:hypothetical protein
MSKHRSSCARTSAGNSSPKLAQSVAHLRELLAPFLGAPITHLHARADESDSPKSDDDPTPVGRQIGHVVPFHRVRLEDIQIGDIVEVDRLGRRFHALVTGNVNGGLSVQPLDWRISYRTCRAHDVAAHWAKRGRPRRDQRAA